MEDIVMCGGSVSLGNELMNCANHRAHQHIKIDLVYATMVLLKLESGGMGVLISVEGRVSISQMLY